MLAGVLVAICRWKFVVMIRSRRAIMLCYRSRIDRVGRMVVMGGIGDE
jgi:hypothetical protein